VRNLNPSAEFPFEIVKEIFLVLDSRPLYHFREIDHHREEPDPAQDQPTLTATTAEEDTLEEEEGNYGKRGIYSFISSFSPLTPSTCREENEEEDVHSHEHATTPPHLPPQRGGGEGEEETMEIRRMGM
jgi:hypothetical protein